MLIALGMLRLFPELIEETPKQTKRPASRSKR
jgi:hypothetical protein